MSVEPERIKGDLPGYPYVSQFLRVDGHRMHYIDEAPAGQESSRQVVLLLHGNPTWSYYYRRLISDLKSSHRVIAPDWIGCGLSDHPTDSHYRATDRIDQLEDFVGQLGLERLSLVMHDWGGPIGTGFALRNLEKIERLVYLNTTLVETESLPVIIKNAARPFLGKILTKYTSHFVNMTTRFGVVNPVPKAVRKAYKLPYKNAARRTAIWDFVADIPFESDHPTYSQTLWMAENLPKLRSKPVQIVWGLKDPCFHREMLNKVVVHFPHAQVLEIANASHLVLEDAGDQANRVIVNFLKNVALNQAGISQIASHQHQRSELSIAVGLEGSFERHGLRSQSEPHSGGHSDNLVAFPNSTNASGAANTTPNATQWSLYRSFQRAAKAIPQAVGCLEARFPLEPGIPGATVQYVQVTFRDLLDQVNKYQRGLRELGLCPGDRVVMLVTPGVEFLALSFAIMGRGAIPVFLDPGMGRERLLQCIEECSPHAFIGVPKAHLLRLIKPKIFKNLRFKLVVSDWPLPGCSTIGVMKRYSSLPLPEVVRFASDPALIAFTSGATGVPKGVVFTHQMLEAQLDIFARLFEVERDLAAHKEPTASESAGVGLDLPLLPIFSIFSLSLGVGSAFAPIDPAHPLALDPKRVVKIIQDLSVRSSFGSPTLWNKISEYCLRSGTTLPSLKKVFMAGAPVPLAVLGRVQDALPNGTVHTPYGATEALPVTLVSALEIREREQRGSLLVPAAGGEIGTFVGSAVPEVDLKIIKVVDEAIHSEIQIVEVPELTIGEIIVTGANVSREYFRRDEATQLAKIRGADGRLWHRMGDLGYRDEAGGIFFCGRKAHMVKASSRTYYSIPTERFFNEHPLVKRSALVSLLGTNPAAGICVEPHAEFWPASQASKERLLSELHTIASKNRITAEIKHFFIHPAFPVDSRHNAKIFREQLSSWANEELKRFPNR